MEMKIIHDCLREGKLPDETKELFDALLMPNPDEAVLTAQESEFLDFKDKFPHSLSQEYGASIIRLCIAFHNTYGGFIAFGVNDETRSTDNNSIAVNLEALNKKVTEVTGEAIELQHIKLDDYDVDIVFIPRRQTQRSPIYLITDYNKYKKGTTWIRRNQETIRVLENEIGLLFSERLLGSEVNSFEDNSLKSYFPQSRSLIQSTIGRADHLIELHKWLLRKRDTILHIYGRGGSGKTKIAYEFATMVRDNPDCNPLSTRCIADDVLFFTAKESELVSMDAEISDISKKSDFSNKRELLEAILIESNYLENEESASSASIFDMSDMKLEDAIHDLFSEKSLFVILDDIDTITTKGKDSGASVVFEAAMRSRKECKILVTQRDVPREWLGKSTEVLGFPEDAQYERFLTACCDKFGQQFPNPRDKDLIYKASGGIPLIIETISGLARSYPSWERAVEEYKGMRGDTAREYLHRREYDAISGDHGKQVLLALSCFNKPATFEDLQFILSVTSEQLSIAISEVQSMFVNMEASTTGIHTYVLTDTASSFLKSIAASSAIFDRIKARYKLRISGRYPKPNAAVQKLIQEMKKALNKGEPELAIPEINREHGVAVEENVHYMGMKAQIYASLNPPQYIEAQKLFRDCLECNELDAYCARSWVNMERAQENHVLIVEEIIPHVLSNASVKSHHAEFQSKLAYSLSILGAAKQFTDPVDAHEFFSKALHANIASLSIDSGSKYFEQGCLNTKTTAWKLVQNCEALDSKGGHLFVKTMQSVGKKYPKYDFSSIAQPFLSYVQTLQNQAKVSGPSSAQRGFLANIKASWRSNGIRFDNQYFDAQLKNMLVEI